MYRLRYQCSGIYSSRILIFPILPFWRLLYLPLFPPLFSLTSFCPLLLLIRPLFLEPLFLIRPLFLFRCSWFALFFCAVVPDSPSFCLSRCFLFAFIFCPVVSDSPSFSVLLFLICPLFLCHCSLYALFYIPTSPYPPPPLLFKSLLWQNIYPCVDIKLRCSQETRWDDKDLYFQTIKNGRGEASSWSGARSETSRETDWSREGPWTWTGEGKDTFQWKRIELH